MIVAAAWRRQSAYVAFMSPLRGLPGLLHADRVLAPEARLNRHYAAADDM
jgi:hypothetical protein